MKLLVDMNLSPDWVAVLEQAGWETVHWSNVGNPRAADSEIMAWAMTARAGRVHARFGFWHNAGGCPG
jgi:predicted nuclease of predicted toxin-antitoxin system